MQVNHGGYQGRRRQRHRPLSEINVTPMVDVMLVLLIVFMVAAPLLTVGVPVDLPKIQAKTLESKTEPVMITIDQQGRLFIKEGETNIDTLLEQLHTITQANPETRIYIRGDKGIPYGAVMAVMGRLNAGGFTKVALVAELPHGAEPLPSGGRGTASKGAPHHMPKTGGDGVEKFPSQ